MVDQRTKEGKTEKLDSRQEWRFTKTLLRSWFTLTGGEQKMVIIILALFILGLTVRFFHGF